MSSGSKPSERYATFPARSRMTVVGKALTLSKRSSPSAKSTVVLGRSSARYGATSDSSSSQFSPKKSTSLSPEKCAATFSKCGSSSRQGPHQVAQKFSTTTLPLVSARGKGAPSGASRTVNSYGSFKPLLGMGLG